MMKIIRAILQGRRISKMSKNKENSTINRPVLNSSGCRLLYTSCSPMLAMSMPISLKSESSELYSSVSLVAMCSNSETVYACVK